MLEGLDVSKWQRSITWTNVAGSDKQFAVCRSTIGQSTQDEMFSTNYVRSSTKGLVPGAYHVVTGDSTAVAQADNLKRMLDSASWSKGVIALDVERDDGASATQVLAIVEKMANIIRNDLKRTPFIYTGYFWRDNLGNPTDNFGCPLWLAYYGADPAPWIPRAWQTEGWTIWQYTNEGTVPGIEGNVDLDKFDGSLRDLKTLAGWEWDEMATKDEITAIVHDEIAAVLSAGDANTTKVVNAVATAATNVIAKINDSEGRLRSDATANTQALKASLSDLLAKVESDQTVEVGQELKDLVNRLHRHLCLPCVAESTDPS